MNYKSFIFVPSMAIALSACMGSSDAFQGPVSDLIAESGGATFTGSAPASIRDYNAGTSARLSPESYEIKLSENANGEIVASVEIFGETVSFTEADLSEHENEFSGTSVSGDKQMYLWTYTGTWGDILEGNADHEFVVAFGASTYDNDTNERIYGVLGSQTQGDDLPISGTAEFAGNFHGAMFLTDSDDRFNSRADVTLSADFENSMIDGRLTSLENKYDGTNYTAEPDEFDIVSTTIGTDGTFETTLSVDAATCGDSCATIATSEVIGGFYGDTAQEAGGTISIDGTTSSGRGFIWDGVFTAGQ